MRTVTPRVRSKRGQKVNHHDRFAHIVAYFEDPNHQLPLLSPPSAPGVGPIHPEQAGQSSGVPPKQPARTEAAFRILPGGVAAETKVRASLPPRGHPAVPTQGEGHDPTGGLRAGSARRIDGNLVVLGHSWSAASSS